MAKPPPLVATPRGDLPLDRALGFAARGDAESALRWAVPLVKADLAAAAALFLVGRELAAVGQPRSSIQALEMAADRAADAGNLPMAIAALAELTAVNADVAVRTRTIADRYAKGSAQLKPGGAIPPAAVPPDVQPLAAALSGAPLVEAATQILEYARAALDADRAKRDFPPPVSAQSLFSSLSAPALGVLMPAFEVRLVAKGDRVIQQGAPGAEAFVLARGELEVVREQPGAAPTLLARLGNGAVFGEMALLARSPRAASVTAARPSVVLFVRAEALDEVAQRSPEVGKVLSAYCQRRMVANLVHTSALLGPLSAGERQALIERFKARTFEAGDKLIAEGEDADGLHVIASGEVHIQRMDGGDQVVIAELGVGDVVGEVSMIFRRPSNADVVALHPTMTLFLPRARFMEIVREHPTLLAQLYELAVKRDEETSGIAAEDAAEADDLVI